MTGADNCSLCPLPSSSTGRNGRGCACGRPWVCCADWPPLASLPACPGTPPSPRCSPCCTWTAFFLLWPRLPLPSSCASRNRLAPKTEKRSRRPRHHPLTEFQPHLWPGFNLQVFSPQEGEGCKVHPFSPCLTQSFPQRQLLSKYK